MEYPLEENFDVLKTVTITGGLILKSFKGKEVNNPKNLTQRRIDLAS